MADTQSDVAIFPGRGLGWMTLGASLHGILTKLKSQPQHYSRIDLAYSSDEPIQEPIILDLSSNGIRLRFDGPDQRLRLIEIVDFAKTTFSYKGTDLVKRSHNQNGMLDGTISGPSFRHVYARLFGPSYAGEYIAPSDGKSDGTYILSYPGLAARFYLKHRAWSEKADFVSLLSSTAASPATSIAIFQGTSWPEARSSLYTAKPHLPRSMSLNGKLAGIVADEIEEVIVRRYGRLELIRRTQPSFEIVLGATTPQDLISELGPPDAVYRKMGAGMSIHASTASKAQRDGRSSVTKPQSDPDELDNGEQNTKVNDESETLSEVFYNYFHHGFDIMISSSSRATDLVVTKVFLHGNVPGSYSFNRHRRCRWRLERSTRGQHAEVTSETCFSEAQWNLEDVHNNNHATEEEGKESLQRGMVLNRGWDESPESSIELLGGFEEGPKESKAGDSVTDNTELYGFPGMLFEVMRNDTIVCLTIYKS